MNATIFLSNLYGSSKMIYKTEFYKIYETSNKTYSKKSKTYIGNDYHITVIFETGYNNHFDIVGNIDNKIEVKKLAWDIIKELKK